MCRVADGRIVNHAASRAKVICEVVTQLERLMRVPGNPDNILIVLKQSDKTLCGGQAHVNRAAIIRICQIITGAISLDERVLDNVDVLALSIIIYQEVTIFISKLLLQMERSP